LLRRFQTWLTGPRSKTRETVETLAIALLLAFGVRAEVASAYFIPSESMLPTLHVGDRIFVEKLSQHFEPPHRGDVVVFDPPPRAHPRLGDVWVKRVVGLPGETIDIRAGHVYVNGRALQEPYAAEAARYPEPDWNLLGMPGGKVPAGSVFVMGDNRNNSADGHVWGALPMQNIIGRSLFRYWPLDRIGPVPRM
jgi:signal peptidase I